MSYSARRFSLAAITVIPAAFAGDVPLFSGIGRPTGTNGSAAVGVSGDGRVIAGLARISGGWQALRWDAANGPELLADLPGGPVQGVGYDLSYDGSVIVGYSAGTDGFDDPVRWVNGGPAEHLGRIQNGRSPAGQAQGVTPDGQIAVGVSSVEGFRWENGSMQSFGIGTYFAAISADASRMGGYRLVDPNDEFRATIWTQSAGFQDLAAPSTEFTSVLRFSGDATVAIGSSGTHAMRWTGGAAEILPSLPGSAGGSAKDISADGSIIVGSARDAIAAMWTADGVFRVKDYLEQELGLSLGAWQLREATGVSDDGTVIVGSGINPDGREEGWYAVIPEPGTAALFTIAITLGLRARRRA